MSSSATASSCRRTSETLKSDPRCLKKKAELDVLAEGLKAANIPMVHWDDADGPTECVFVHNQDFKAYLWEAFMPTSTYADWLLQTDMSSAYAWERSVLQVLQSTAPGMWSLKMPSHAVHIESLLAEFPDARIVWAHRDPIKSTASFLRLNYLSRAVLGAEIDVDDIVPNVLRQLREHVIRPMQTRRRIGDDRFFDLHYAELMRDPIGVMRSLYDWAGDALTPSTEQAMLDWLKRHPQDRFGVQPYSLDDAGVTKADLKPIFSEYLDVFDIEMEGEAS
jgi:Sulfotransferase family